MLIRFSFIILQKKTIRTFEFVIESIKALLATEKVSLIEISSV